jgi:Family of unknown function (DUF6185)
MRDLRDLTRALSVVVALVASLLIMLVGTIRLVIPHYHATATDNLFDCTEKGWQTSATVTVTATITTTGVTYPRLENTVDIAIPIGSPGSTVLFDDVASPRYRQSLGCLLGRSYWQQDQDQRPAPPTIVADHDQLKIHYVSTGDLVPHPRSASTRIGYFNSYYDDNDDWTLDLAYPHYLMGARWSVTLNAPPGWLNSPQPAPTSVPGNTRMEWDPIQPIGTAVEAGGDCSKPTDCLRVKLDVAAPYRLMAAGSWYPGGLVMNLLVWASWFAMLVWTYTLTSAHVAGRLRPGGRPISIRRILLPVLLISGAAIVIIGIGYTMSTSPGWDFPTYLSLTLAEGMILTVLAMISALCWGLSPLPVALVGLLALATAGVAGSNLDRQDEGIPGQVVILMSVYGLMFLTLAVAGFLSAMWLLIAGNRAARHPEYLCWIAGTVIALVLLAERNAVQTAAMSSGFWLSATFPTYSELVGGLITLPTDLSSTANYVFGPLVVGALLRAMFETAGWDEGVGHPRARARLLNLGAAVFFAGVDWDVTLWTWPLLLWVILIPLVALTFRRFHSILDLQVSPGSTLRSVVIDYGLDNLRADAKQWRAAIRAGRSVDKRLGQGSIEMAEHRAEIDRIDREADRSRGLILAHGVDRLQVDVTPIDLLLTIGPYCSRTANARFAAKVAALWGLPFLVVLTGWRWHSRGLQDGGSYLLSIAADAAWMAIVLVGSSTVIGLVWQHLPGRRGPLRVLPLVALYMITPVANSAVPYVTDTEKYWLGLIEVLCFLAVTTSVGLAMDLRALREIRPPWQLRVQALAFAYGTENLPAQIAFLSAQLSAVIALVTFWKTGALPDVGSSGSPSAEHPTPGH